jgi:hypothetical protein
MDKKRQRTITYKLRLQSKHIKKAIKSNYEKSEKRSLTFKD